MSTEQINVARPSNITQTILDPYTQQLQKRKQATTAIQESIARTEKSLTPTNTNSKGISVLTDKLYFNKKEADAIFAFAEHLKAFSNNPGPTSVKKVKSEQTNNAQRFCSRINYLCSKILAFFGNKREQEALRNLGNERIEVFKDLKDTLFDFNNISVAGMLDSNIKHNWPPEVKKGIELIVGPKACEELEAFSRLGDLCEVSSRLTDVKTHIETKTLDEDTSRDVLEALNNQTTKYEDDLRKSLGDDNFNILQNKLNEKLRLYKQNGNNLDQ